MIGLNEAAEVPYGSFTRCIRTEHRNPLESGAAEHKVYCPDVGQVLEEPAGGGGERVELIEVAEP